MLLEEQQCNKTEKQRIIRLKKLVYIFKSKRKLRKDEVMKKQAAIVESNEKLEHEVGVKGVAAVSFLPYLDISTAFIIPEQMHAVFLGVQKQFTCHWFHAALDKAYSLKKYSTEINNLLLKITPPNSFHRLPRTIFDYKKVQSF